MHSSSRVRSLAVMSPLAFALAFAASANAATRVDLHHQDVGQMYRQYKAASARIGMPAKAADRHAEMLGLGADSALQLVGSATDKDGTRNYRYRQTYHGIPVFGENVIVSENADGSVRHAFGHRLDGIGADVASLVARIPNAQALALGRHAAFGNRVAALDVTARPTTAFPCSART